MIKSVAAGVADEEIFVAIVVVISRRYSEAVSEIHAAEACFGRDVLKGAISFVAQQAIVVRLVGFF